MGVLSNNRSQITSGGLISASFVSDLYDVLTGNTLESVSISGSINVTGSIVGNVTGTASTASYVANAVSASYANTASYVANAISASFSQTASYVNGISSSIQHVEISNQLIVQGVVLLYTASLPTTDPVNNGQLWRSGSFLMISTGSGI
jgi:hypothetical protein